MKSYIVKSKDASIVLTLKYVVIIFLRLIIIRLNLKIRHLFVGHPV